MKGASPEYVCLGPDGYRTTHEQGTVLFVGGTVTAFGCKRCGVVYWEHPAPPSPTYDSQCRGITVKGKRCKIDAVKDGFCLTHQGQKPPSSGHL